MIPDPKRARTQDEHSPTPRPWELGMGFKTIYGVVDGHVKVLCSFEPGPEGGDPPFMPEGMSEANRRLVVHCVNAHDALVEACQKAVALIELKYPATVAEAVSRWVVGDEVRGDVATTYMALRAALDAAKGAAK